MLLEQLKLSKEKLFGRSAEQAGEAVMEQLSLLFNEAEVLDAESFVEEQTDTKVKSYTRRRRSGSIQEDVYYTYACKSCEAESGDAFIVKPPKEPVVIPGSFASPEASKSYMSPAAMRSIPLCCMSIGLTERQRMRRSF